MEPIRLLRRNNNKHAKIIAITPVNGFDNKGYIIYTVQDTFLNEIVELDVEDLNQTYILDPHTVEDVNANE